MVETFVAGEGGILSSSVVEQSVEIEIILERSTFDPGGFCLRMFFGVDGVGRDSRFGTVIDLWTALFEGPRGC